MGNAEANLVQGADGVVIVPQAPALGAEVRCGNVRGLNDVAFAAVVRALLDNLVIRVRGQILTDPELIAFGKRLGALDCAPLAKTGKARTHPEIVVVSNVTENGQAIGVLRDAEVVWHSDNSYRGPFDGGYRRVRHRIQCAGDKPALRSGARGHPRAHVDAHA